MIAALYLENIKEHRNRLGHIEYFISFMDDYDLFHAIFGRYPNDIDPVISTAVCILCKQRLLN